MVQWTANVDQLFFKNILKIHDIKLDWKELEKAMRAEGVDVTQKGLMHRVTKIKSVEMDRAEPGKANLIKNAKRGIDGKPKTVIPDPESGSEDAEVESPAPKKAKKTKAKATGNSSDAPSNKATNKKGTAKKVKTTYPGGIKKLKRSDSEDEGAYGELDAYGEEEI